MRIDFLTAFPGMFTGPLDESMVRQASQRNLVELFVYDLRAFTTDRHMTIDDSAYGGGSGMVIKPEPVFGGVRFIRRQLPPNQKSRAILLSARGRRYTQEMAKELVDADQIILVCGHYKGIDERVIDGLKLEEVSVGDFVVTGGELPALMIADSVIRLIPGTLNDMESALSDSFYDGVLDCPVYTRPETFEGERIPDVLVSGHHERIRVWRRQESLQATWLRRPDLLEKMPLSKADQLFLTTLRTRNERDNARLDKNQEDKG